MVKSNIKNKNERTNNINDNESSIIKSDRIFLETPIIDKNDDNFGALTYSEQLYYAIKKGAKFIAVDGEYGTGKSSVINLLKKKNQPQNYAAARQHDELAPV